MSAPGSKPAWVKYACLIAGLGLIIAACTELYLTYAVVWPQWQKTKAASAQIAPAQTPAKTPPAGAKPGVLPAPVKPGTPPVAANAATPAAPAVTLPQMLSKYTVVFARDVVFLIAGFWLVIYSSKNPRQTSTSAVMEAASLSPGGGMAVSTAIPAFTPAKVASGAPSKRWQSANIVQLNEAGRKLWTFTAGKSGFGQGQEHTIPAAQPLPAFVKRDWKSLVQPKLNIAWLPVEQVFLRVVQLPAGDFNETLAMVELQLEKISPLPVTQIVWAIELMPQKGELQTVIVIMVSRDLVEQFLGDLEKQGFMAHRLELPLLDQLLVTKITEDGAYVYPESGADKISALVAWWYGGVLRNLGLVRLPVAGDPSAALKEQLAQMAWSGELEGWLHKTPRWHLVADEATAAQWKTLFSPWLDEPVPSYLPLTLPQLALTNANRASRADLGIGILPPEYFIRYQQEFYDSLWMRGLFTLLGVYCLGVIIYLAAVNWQGMGTDELDQKRASLSREYTNTLRIKAQMEILLNRQALKFASLDCWEKSAEYLPEGVTIQNLDFKDGRHLSLSGVAGSDKGDAITDFYDNLRRVNLNDQPMFEKLESPVTRFGQGNLTWSFGGDLSRAEDLK